LRPAVLHFVSARIHRVRRELHDNEAADALERVAKEVKPPKALQRSGTQD
jgi:hypothetical protein